MTNRLEWYAKVGKYLSKNIPKSGELAIRTISHSFASFSQFIRSIICEQLVKFFSSFSIFCEQFVQYNLARLTNRQRSLQTEPHGPWFSWNPVGAIMIWILLVKSRLGYLASFMIRFIYMKIVWGSWDTQWNTLSTFSRKGPTVGMFSFLTHCVSIPESETCFTCPTSVHCKHP